MIDSKNHHIPSSQKHSWALASFNMQLHDLKEKTFKIDYIHNMPWISL
jgi:hypothetical protein